MPYLRYFIGLYAVLFVTTTWAEAYKWVDDTGLVHFDQHPPAGDVQYETIDMPSSNPSDAEETEQPAQKTADKTQEDPPAATPEQIQQKNCDTARERLAVLEQNQKVAMTDPNGKPQILNDEQRQAEIARSQESVKRFCEPPANTPE